MALSARWVAVFLLVLVLLAAADMGSIKVAEGRTCESRSRRFRGICVSRNNCALVCRTECFHTGHCRGFRRRCFCVKKMRCCLVGQHLLFFEE
uniref:Knottins-like domain-containing protein n=1 Tax=Kalanchoe fedtschenkoi TaxID=63787 RepID=A0A7N0ZZL6_KALFE